MEKVIRSEVNNGSKDDPNQKPNGMGERSMRREPCTALSSSLSVLLTHSSPSYLTPSTPLPSGRAPPPASPADGRWKG